MGTAALGMEAGTTAKQKCRPSLPLVLYYFLSELCPLKLLFYILNIHTRTKFILLITIHLGFIAGVHGGLPCTPLNVDA